MEAKATVLGLGDVILDAPNPESFFENSKDMIRAADIAIANMEDPHTSRPSWSNPESHSAPASDLDNLRAYKYAGIDVATIGGNHCFDQGAYGILDPIAYFQQNGIATCGAGKDYESARKPAILERNGIRFAFLHYNLTGPRECYATIMKTGCAYIRVGTAYCNDRAEPGGSPTAIYTVADPRGKRNMVGDILAAKKLADNVIVYFHSGSPGKPLLNQYELDIMHYAVDVGAEMVLAAHTHALASIEIYRNKPIFYGLGNFVTVTGAMNPNAKNAKQRHTDFYGWPGIQPWWDYDIFKMIRPGKVPNYPFADHSRNTIMAKAEFSKEGIVSCGFIPCWINDQAQPTPVTRDGKGADVVAYLQDWEKRAGFDFEFQWNEEGTEIVFDLTQDTLIPCFLILKKIGLLNTYSAIALTSCGAFGVLLIHQFMEKLPNDLLEAADIDGCGEVGKFTRIVLPLIKPCIVSLAIFTFISVWGSLVLPLIVNTKESMTTLTVAIANMKSDKKLTDYGFQMAAATLSFAPPFILYLFMLSYLMGAVAAGLILLYLCLGKKQKIRFLSGKKRGFPPAAYLVQANCGAFSYYLNMVCSANLPATILAVVSTGFSLIMTTLAAWIFFREKPTLLVAGSMAVTVAAMALL